VVGLGLRANLRNRGLPQRTVSIQHIAPTAFPYCIC
jgi:hypothetical protein